MYNGRWQWFHTASRWGMYVSLVPKEGNCTTGVYKHRGVTPKNIAACLHAMDASEFGCSVPSAGKVMLNISELPRYTLHFLF